MMLFMRSLRWFNGLKVNGGDREKFGLAVAERSAGAAGHAVMDGAVLRAVRFCCGRKRRIGRCAQRFVAVSRDRGLGTGSAGHSVSASRGTTGWRGRRR
jgi:hypothetical protein